MGQPNLSPRRLRALLAAADRPAVESARLARLVSRFATLPPPPDPVGLLPRYAALHAELLAALAGEDGEAVEAAFLALYVHLHGHEAPYTGGERAGLDRTGGYWCHAGGLAPVLKAPEWVGADTRSIDLGAGNGLQLLLVQLLAPHRLSVQVEISAAMLEAGRALQRWLGIPEARVEWRHADVTTVSVTGFDLVYLYRPVRPDGPAGEFYPRLAADLDRTTTPLVVLSVADCLGPHLSPAFTRLYFDGHLACFHRNGVRSRTM